MAPTTDTGIITQAPTTDTAQISGAMNSLINVNSEVTANEIRGLQELLQDLNR